MGHVLPLQRLITLLMCLSCLGIALAWAVGRVMGRADDPRALHFDACAGSPCLLGIVPGATEWGDAAARLAQYTPRESGDKRIIVPLPGAEIETYISVNSHTVGRIYFSFRRDTPISAAWIIQRYGVPCGVSIYTNGDLLTLRYPLLLANVRVGSGMMAMDAPVTAIRFADPHFEFESQPDPCTDNITSRQMLNTRWQGFAPIALYWRRADM